VFIAFFGGLAGIVAGTRTQKGNVIPGVAIATALMPTLCTAGFGLAKDGTMMMKDGKMIVMKNGSWEEMKETMTRTDGCKVITNGDVKMKDHTTKLKEGEMIDKDGNMMDKDGKMMDEM
jgi:hypothetical protein